MSEKIFTTEKKISTEKKILTLDQQKQIAESEERLAIIAQVVGSDFKMSVKFGESGGGSFFNPESVSITLDPSIIFEGKEHLAEFIAGHEGGHRAITRSLGQIGVKKAKVLELYDKIGYGYSDNCHEDCANNDWVARVFERFKEFSDSYYQKIFQTENAPIVTPEVQRIIGLLGYIPKFVSFNSEIMRKWATNGYSEKLELEVRDALRKTIKHSQDFWQTIPDKFSNEDERTLSARERFRIFYENIWPEIEKLVKIDLNQEKMRELADKMMKKMKARAENKEKEEPEKSGGEGLSLPKEMMEELLKATQDNMEKQLERLKKGLDELNEKLERSKQSGDKKKQEEIEGKIKELMDNKDDLEKGEKNIVPWDKLSDSLKDKLKEIYKNLPKEIRDELDKKAKQTLKGLDDQMIKDSRGKLTKNETPMTHKEVENAKEAMAEQARLEKQKEEKEKSEERERNNIEQEISRKTEEELSEYDRIYKEIAPLVDEMYNRIHQIFLPQRHPRWIKGHPTGQRLDLLKVMQFQTDKGQHDKLWERKTMPQKIDYKFTILNDLSGSMSGTKIQQDVRGKILIVEVLNRLGIKAQILGFQDEIILYKDFDQELSPDVRKKMTIMLREVDNNGEHNKAGWNSDGYCLQKASEMLNLQKGKDSFLIVLSDGEPVPDSAHAGEEYNLHKVVADVRKKTRQKLIGLGIGPDTKHVGKYYPTSLPNIPLADLPRLLGDLLENMIKSPSKFR